LQTLATAFGKSVDIGIPLPEVYPTLTKAGIKLRRSQVVMIAGQPGARKSTLALNLVIGMGVPTLYFSADADEWTTSLRAAAALSGTVVDEVERGTKDNGAEDYYTDVLSELDHVWWCFDSDPTPESMAVELDAFTELYGCFPECVVIDNLCDITLEGDNEWAAMRKVMKLVRFWARTTRACVVVLHHCQEGDIEPFACPPRKAIQGKLTQLQSLILTVAVDETCFKVACVKNRHGPADPSGETAWFLVIDPPRMRISEPERRAA